MKTSTLPPDVLSATRTELDALGAAAELQFRDSAGRYSHADWAREQQAEPACHAVMRYVARGRPPFLPADFLSCFPLHQCPSFSEIQELAGKGQLHTTDDGIVLLLRKPTPQTPVRLAAPGGTRGLLVER